MSAFSKAVVQCGAGSVLSLVFAAPPAAGQTLVTKFHGPSAYDLAGSSVAVDAAKALVGAPRAHGSALSGAGAAYLLRVSSSGWPASVLAAGVQELARPSFALSESFGAAVAMNGELIVVGEPDRDLAMGLDDVGCVHVYRDDGATAHYESTLLPSVLARARAGASVAAHADRVAVGAPGADAAAPDAGEVHIFQRAVLAPHWSAPEVVLVPPVGSPGDHFGGAVALRSVYCAVGAPGHDGSSADEGAVYVYRRSTSGWALEATVLAPAPLAGARFGGAVALDGEFLLVGASGEDGAYMFRRTPVGEWSLVTRFGGVDPLLAEGFGAAVALAGDVAVVGAVGNNAVHTFRRVGPVQWLRSQRLSEPYTAALGGAVAVSSLLVGPHGETNVWVVGGAPLDSAAGAGAGAAFFYFTPTFVDAFAFGESGGCPCSNSDPLAGCANSTGAGARLRSRGTNSTSLGDFAVSASGLPPSRPCLLLLGDGALQSPLGAGIRAVGPGVEGFARLLPGTSSVAGVYELPLGVLAHHPKFVALVSPGETWNFQVWYRDAPFAACASQVNFSNALAVGFLP